MLIQQFTFPVHRATVEKIRQQVDAARSLCFQWRLSVKGLESQQPHQYGTQPQLLTDKDKVAIPKAIFLSGSGEYNRYRANEIDVTYGIPSDQVKVADIEFPGQVRRTTSLCSWYLEPNHGSSAV